MNEPQKDVTILLDAISAGDQSAPEKLLEAVYDDLRRLAAKYMRDERGDHTLQATALVHEAYIRLVDGKMFRGKIARIFSLSPRR
jgi:DNA-directed RNA polymerase specialized sigma24 family protein